MFTSWSLCPAFSDVETRWFTFAGRLAPEKFLRCTSLTHRLDSFHDSVYIYEDKAVSTKARFLSCRLRLLRNDSAVPRAYPAGGKLGAIYKRLHTLQ